MTSPTLAMFREWCGARAVLADAREEQHGPEVVAVAKQAVAEVAERMFAGGEVEHVRCSHRRMRFVVRIGGGVAVAGTGRGDWLSWGGSEWPRRVRAESMGFAMRADAVNRNGVRFAPGARTRTRMAWSDIDRLVARHPFALGHLARPVPGEAERQRLVARMNAAARGEHMSLLEP